MPKYGGRELASKGMKGTSTGLPDDKAHKNWMPEVLFQPQDSGYVNRANCQPVEPTWVYNERDISVFRPRGPGDIEELASQPPVTRAYGGKGKRWHPVDWKAP